MKKESGRKELKILKKSLDARKKSDIHWQYTVAVSAPDEAGLLEANRRLNVPVKFYSADELNAVPGVFDESEFVRKTVGVGNVCERAACAAGGTLMIRKTARDGVTVAAAVSDWRITF